MHVTILGAGAWGTALGLVAADAGHSVRLWAREDHVVADVNERHINPTFLPDVVLPTLVGATSSITDALEGQERALVILSIPTQHIRTVLAPVASHLAGASIVDVSKGIERGTHLRVSEILSDIGVKMQSYTVLSGPSHAEEVGRRLPTTVVAASHLPAAAEFVQRTLTTDAFRIYTSDDVTGVEICGALKNVIAIAAGMIDGVGLADNTKAALITRGLAEIARLGVALGARTETFSGLAGLGDLFVTCTSRHSRNRYVGEQIAKGRTLDDVLADMTAVAEGVPTAIGAIELARDLDVELPITEKVAAILFDGVDPREALRDLMARPMRTET